MNEIKEADSSHFRNAVFRLEDYMKQQPQVEIQHIHRFAPGVYSREMIVPADTFLTGMVHKTEHISIFLSGRMMIPDANGGSVEIVAPIVEIAKPGVKRAGYAIEEVRWITIHATYTTDLDELEKELVTNDPVEAQILADQSDYLSLGLDNLIEQMQAIEVHYEPIPGLEIIESARHGKGVFVNGHIKSGAIIAPAIKQGLLMQWSRYTNHSASPNALIRWCNSSADLIALRDIENEELTVNYRESLRGRT